MQKHLINSAITFVLIFISLGLGKIINQLLGGLPASLYGLLIFAGLLSSGFFNTEACGQVVAKIIYYMPIVFLPVCVGVMEYFDLFAKIGLQVLFIGIVTTLLGIVVVAWSSRYALDRFAKAADEQKVSQHD